MSWWAWRWWSTWSRKKMRNQQGTMELNNRKWVAGVLVRDRSSVCVRVWVLSYLFSLYITKISDIFCCLFSSLSHVCYPIFYRGHSRWLARCGNSNELVSHFPFSPSHPISSCSHSLVFIYALFWLSQVGLMFLVVRC